MFFEGHISESLEAILRLGGCVSLQELKYFGVGREGLDPMLGCSHIFNFRQGSPSGVEL